MGQERTGFDITGQRFGKLTAQKRLSGENSRARWQCVCDCGNEPVVLYRDLAYGKTRSCGCARGAKARDLTGRRFGRLVAQARLPEKKDGSYLWRCQCDCGVVTSVTASALTKGQAKSCGCLSAEAKRAQARDLTGRRFGRLTAIAPTEKRSANGGVIWRCVCDCSAETFQIASVLARGGVTSCGCKHQETQALRQSLRYVDGTCVQFISNSATRRTDNTSGVRGVSPHRGKWRARITFQKKTYYLGTFTDLDQAVEIRKKAEAALYGEFLDWYNETFPEKWGREEESTNK